MSKYNDLNDNYEQLVKEGYHLSKREHKIFSSTHLFDKLLEYQLTPNDIIIAGKDLKYTMFPIMDFPRPFKPRYRK